MTITNCTFKIDSPFTVSIDKIEQKMSTQLSNILSFLSLLGESSGPTELVAKQIHVR